MTTFQVISISLTIITIITSGLMFFLKRFVSTLDKISEDIHDMKTIVARHEERHAALEKRVAHLEEAA